MRSDKLTDALGEIREDFIRDAEYKKRKKRFGWLPAVAAACVCLLIGSLIYNGYHAGRDGENGLGAGYVLAAAVYPEAVKKVDFADYQNDYERYEKEQRPWMEAWTKRGEEAKGLPEELSAFYHKIISGNLTAADGENIVCSPANLFISFAMLAEVTGGDSREQILELLGAETIEQVRDRAARLWNSNYIDDGALVSILANSIWTNSSMKVSEDVLEVLVGEYFTDVYSGKPTDEGYSKELQNWLNEKTGGLLSDQISEIKMDPQMLVELVSTIYFRGKWISEFDPAETKEDIFHGTEGDTSAMFLSRETSGVYNFYDHFGAISLGFDGMAEMWLIRPDDGYTPEEIAAEADFAEFLKKGSRTYDEAHLAYTEIDFKFPKFDITSEIDEKDVIKKLGVSDVFDFETADFRPLLGEEPAYLSTITHTARVTVDEEGCTATAFTVEAMAGAGMPQGKVEFILDKPFLFAITSSTGAILFTGIVNKLP